jgi:spermidine synthase
VKRRPSRLLAIESPFPDANVKLRLLEPPDSCHETLRERVYSGSYDKPFVLDNGPRRFLHFDFGAIQSVMELSNPVRLALAYTRKMMAFLLFNRTPKKILLLGLGGGSLAKFCFANLPAASLTAVELNQDVISLRDEFGIPADDHRFRVINADGADYVSILAHSKDVILADACDRKGIAAGLGSVEFYRKARRGLSANGIFVANICGDKDTAAAQLAKLREAFEDELLSLKVQTDGSIIVFGFKERRSDVNWERIEADAADLKQRFHLDFPRYARCMAVDSNLREARAARDS